MSDGLRVTFYDVPPHQRWPKIQSLAEAALRKDMRLLVHCAAPEVARELDDWLWTFREDSFVPHEFVPGGGQLRDAQANIVLVAAEMNPHRATILVQEAPATMQFAQTFASVIDLVDHRTPQALQASRQRFKDWRSVEGAKLDFRKG